VTILRAVDARFERAGEQLVAPLRFALRMGMQTTLPQPDERAASIAARLCAAIVRPTAGDIYVGEYETRLQPPQAKRLVGFVDAAGFGGDAHAFDCDASFRAEVWGLDRAHARTRARRLLEELAPRRGGSREAYARAVALALVPMVALVVLDRPPPGMAERVRALVPEAGLLVTQVARRPSSATVSALHPLAR
jgi:ABC-type Na+ transport system ATPase subunit NatA